jgi:flagellar L-ring protein precursor FlgH
MKKRDIVFLLSFITLLFFSGCTANLTDPEIDFKPPTYVEQMPALENKRDYVATGSIFGQGETPLFSDHKARNVNDIVTVSISETASSSNSAAKQMSESDDMSLGGIASTKSGVVAGTGLDVGIQGASTSAYKGSGSSTKDASFSTTISARIVKVLENGNYFIAGKREILVDDQKQIIQISGVIRPFDIDQYNKIDSNQMSEAKILYKTQGDVDRAAKQGWGTKIIQAAWPF